MNEKEALERVIKEQFGRTDEEVAEILYNKSDGELREDAVESILALSAERVEKLNAEKQKFFDNGFKKAEAQVLKRVESRIRERAGVDGESFDDLLDAALTAKKPKLTDDDVKRHPVYLSKEANSVPKDEFDKLKSEYDEYVKTQQRNQSVGKIKDMVWNKTLSLNPVESENPRIRENIRGDFLRRFDAFDYDFVDDTVVVLKNGERYEDKHGNLVKFDDFVQAMASEYYEFKAQDDEGSAGNESGGGSVPQTKEEYAKALAAAKTPEERVRIKRAFESR